MSSTAANTADTTEVPSTTTNTSADNSLSTTSKEPQKIEVLFRNTGNAPIMKRTKWSVNSSYTVSDSLLFIRKYLKLDQSQSLFLYVNQSFAPSLDQTIQNLYDCYESDKKLILYYATTQAWG